LHGSLNQVGASAHCWPPPQGADTGTHSSAAAPLGPRRSAARAAPRQSRDLFDSCPDCCRGPEFRARSAQFFFINFAVSRPNFEKIAVKLLCVTAFDTQLATRKFLENQSPKYLEHRAPRQLSTVPVPVKSLRSLRTMRLTHTRATDIHISRDPSLSCDVAPRAPRLVHHKGPTRESCMLHMTMAL
jgi:hypothetical protein